MRSEFAFQAILSRVHTSATDGIAEAKRNRLDSVTPADRGDEWRRDHYVLLELTSGSYSLKLGTDSCLVCRTIKSIGIPCFLKVSIMPLCFYERPTLVHVFAN